MPTLRFSLRCTAAVSRTLLDTTGYCARLLVPVVAHPSDTRTIRRGMQFYSKKLLSPGQLKRLSEHKYSCTTNSLLDALLQPWWDWLVSKVPLWLAPNLITVLGLIVNILTTLILVYYSPDAKAEVRLGLSSTRDSRSDSPDVSPRVDSRDSLVFRNARISAGAKFVFGTSDRVERTCVFFFVPE